MNPPIVRLYAFFALLFGMLVFATSWWAVFTAPKLRDNASNRRPLLAEERIKRGTIRSADGKVLARSVKIDKERYRRTYPTKAEFAHAIGYSFTTLGRSGLEQFRNDPLTGRRTELIGAIDSLLSKRGEGDSLRTTLNTKAQQAAIDGLHGRKGAVVALEPSTGKVLVMVSTPSYDPNNLDKGNKFKRLATDDANSPLVNRATQAGYPPGSTMKAVTATAALDSGKFKPDSTVSGKNGKKISGVPLNNFGGEDFGDITLTDALTNSVNTVWAEVGEKLGKNTMAKYMLRYGFYKQPPIDLPDDQLLASGERGPNGKLLRPRSPRIDVGRMAIGQDKLLVTPLQMATVAATIANGGVRMEPHITQKIVDPDGRTQDEIEPKARRASHGRRHRSCVDRDDEAGRQGGHGHGGGARGRRAGRQDRHRGDQHRAEDQRPLVHRLHQRLRDRGRAGAGPGRPGRRRGGADRQAGARGAGQMSVHGIARDTVVDERYKVLNRIGSGGMADVYCAEDLQLGRRVALKLLYRRFAEDEEFVERFRREASSAAGLQHPNVVAVFDRGEFDGTYYIAMEFLEGRSLKQLVRQEGALEPDRAIDLVHPDPQGGALRPPARDRAPRHQAPQRDRRRRGAREGHRLRDRARRRVGHDRDRLDHGHGAVPLARAGPGPPGRRARRPLLDRRRAVRAADRAGAVRRRVGGDDRAQAGHRGAGAAVAATTRRSPTSSRTS